VSDLDLPMPMARLLVARGLVELEKIDRFLNPRLSDLSDPFELKDMDKAVDRILQAIAERQSILIYGDYDVDGITSTALMVNVLSALGGSVTPFLPHRIDDGYGLNVETLLRCIEQCHPRLIVTVDCGTGSVEAVRKAAEMGVDVVVTDHHEPPDECAPALAIVNPKLCGNPATQMLAGVGVAFKLCHALLKKARADGWVGAESIDLRNYLDMVALGTIADIVPLLHENRILAYHGLSLLNRTQSVGLKSLIEVSGITGFIDSYHVGFILGPRINAMGRMGSAQKALELLLTDHAPRAKALAMDLDAANRERQEVETRIVKEACARIDEYFDPARHFGLVVSDQAWHTGVIGIVASRLVGRYYRPVVVIGLEPDGVGRGSCRSIEGFDLLAHLAKCSDLLLKFGGHAMAAGLEVEVSRIPEFVERFNAVVAETLGQVDLRPVQPIDAWLSLPEIDKPFLEWQERLKPFGHGNKTPIWAASDIRFAGTPRIVGKSHLKATLTSRGTQHDAIGFGMADREIPQGSFDAAFSVAKNTYYGDETIQLHLQDFRKEPAAE
ncbi:MAG: single-stranded-DNA-specific exonuclease RecJ, partial [Lentisphaerota bacterium]